MTSEKPENIQEILKAAWITAWELEGWTWEEKEKTNNASTSDNHH